MAKVEMRPDESLDSMLQRFKRLVKQDGTLNECRLRESFLTKNEKKKLKQKLFSKGKRRRGR